MNVRAVRLAADALSQIAGPVFQPTFQAIFTEGGTGFWILDFWIGEPGAWCVASTHPTGLAVAAISQQVCENDGPTVSWWSRHL